MLCWRLQCQHSCQFTVLMYFTLAVAVHLIGQGALYNDMLCAFITKPTLVPIILLFPRLFFAHYCTVDTHANLLSVLWGLFELCVCTNTVHWPRCTVLYSCTEVHLWPIKASHNTYWLQCLHSCQYTSSIPDLVVLTVYVVCTHVLYTVCDCTVVS